VGILRRKSWGALCVGTAATITLLGLTAGTASAANPVTAPFTECPAIGAAPSCDILLVVNSNRTISVLGNSSIDPYDGGDDTLVGIVNNSSKPVPVITVSGSGSDLAGFDGDGICVYSAGAGGSGFTGDNYCDSLQRGGTDPEDYAGPTTSFTLDPSSHDDVEVDFAGSGLPAGGSTYFSLEGALTSAAITAQEGTLTPYVALGDSYSSGEGNPPFMQPDTGCDRSVSKAWPELVASMFGIKLDLLACSGATTAALTSTYDGQDPQLAALSSLKAPSLVTITMGGNDLGFAYVLGSCFVGLSGNCTSALAGLEGTLAGGFGKHMTAVYKAIKAAAPGAHVLVVGYPQIIPSNPFSAIAHCPGIINPIDVVLMHHIAGQLNSVLSHAAAAAGVSYVSTLNVLKGHELCTANSWVNSVGLSSGAGHPTAQGQAMIAAAVEDYVAIHHLLPGT
jgi:lysophospholipase L1-like esterase